MEFYNSLISEISSYTDSLSHKVFPYLSDNPWPDIGYSQVILQRDTAYELDGVGFNLYTDSDVNDGITVAGDELSSISSNRSFSRVCIVQLDTCSDEQETYKTIKKADYVKYHYFPEGYMIRTTSRSHKESVRVAESALKSGINFQKIGSMLISKYKENPKVKAVQVIYFTAENADYTALNTLAEKSGNITEALNHIMNSVKIDCDTCNLKAVCDEIDGMKELHFRNRA